MYCPASYLDHPFAHIVCYRIHNPGNLFGFAFKLHRGKRLQLLDIVLSQLLDAGSAFLSACHTAELTEDDVLHHAADVSLYHRIQKDLYVRINVFFNDRTYCT